MAIVIRNARTSPLGEILEWRMEVLDHVFGFGKKEDLSSLYAQNRKYYERALENKEHEAVFAELDGRTAGCGGVCFFEDHFGRKHAYLMNIYVRDAYRHQHVGEAIVKALIRESLKRGCELITLETSEDGRGLYRHLGFRDENDLMKLSSGKPASPVKETDGPFCFYREMPSPDNPDGSCAYFEAAGKQDVEESLPAFIREARRNRSKKVYAKVTPESASLFEEAGFLPMPDMMILDQEFWREHETD